MLALACNPTARGSEESMAKLYALASTSAAFESILPAPPRDWSLSILFVQRDGAVAESKGARADEAGNLWVFDKSGTRIEFVGGARYADSPGLVVPLTAAANGAD